MFRTACIAILTACALTSAICIAVLTRDAIAAPAQTPASPVAAAPTTTAPVTAPSDSARNSYLAELRAASVPVSTTGTPDVLLGVGICNQLADGVSRDQVVTDINAMLAPLYGIDGFYHAVNTVDAAERILCAS